MVNWKSVRRWVRIIWIGAGLSFTAWIVWNMQAHGVPGDAWQSSASIDVREVGEATVFMPAVAPAGRPALVFLPGGGVDPAAYVPVVRAVADAGWPTALVRLPWGMAFSESAEDEVWRRIAGVRGSWGAGRPIILGGHSRGAAIASRFADRHGPDLAGLILIGTTHPRDHNLSALPIPVMKISGTRDCVAGIEATAANRSLLPAATEWVTIEGANHAQFGYYGTQLGDCGASIGREEQQRRTREAIEAFLSAVTAKVQDRIQR